MCKNRLLLVAGEDDLRTRARCGPHVSVELREVIRDQPAHRTGGGGKPWLEVPFLLVRATRQACLLRHDLRHRGRGVGEVVAPASPPGEILQQGLSRFTRYADGREGDVRPSVRIQQVREWRRRTLAVRQQDDMLHACLRGLQSPVGHVKRGVDVGAPIGLDRRNAVGDRPEVRRPAQGTDLRDPPGVVVEGDHTDLITLAQRLDGKGGALLGEIHAARTAVPRVDPRHAAGTVDHDDDRERRRLVVFRELHRDREGVLKRGPGVLALPEGMFPTGHHQSAPA